MLRRARLLIPLVLGLLLLIPQSAHAAIVNVSADDNLFSPPTAQARIGDTVHWTNDGLSFHTSSGDAPLSFWDSGFMSSGSTFDFLFWGAGGFPYNCEIHSEMTGTVSVRPSAGPQQGPPGTQFTIRAGSTDAPAPYVFDIQKKEPGGNWAVWKSNVTTRNNVWDSTGKVPGTYQFRVRVKHSGSGAASRWSPAVSVKVT